MAGSVGQSSRARSHRKNKHEAGHETCTEKKELAVGRRGYWQDAQTFMLELFDIGQLTRRLYFHPGLLEVTIPEAELTIECQVQAP